jgi:hypothetical protein
MGQSMIIALMSAPFAAFAQDVDVNGNQHEGDSTMLNLININFARSQGSISAMACI